MPFNQVVLMGNLTRDPELKYLPSGTACCEIGLAVNERVKKGEQWVDEPNFFDITMFGRTAEVANEYLAKGSQALFSGRLQFRQWEKDGQKRSKVSVIAEKMQMCGSKSDRPAQEPQSQQQDAGDDSFPDELPF